MLWAGGRAREGIRCLVLWLVRSGIVGAKYTCKPHYSVMCCGLKWSLEQKGEGKEEGLFISCVNANVSWY